MTYYCCCCCWSVTYRQQLLHYNPLAVLVHFRLSVHGGPQEVFAAVQPLAHLPLRRHSNSEILRRFVSLPVVHLYRQTFVLAIPEVTATSWSVCQNFPRQRGRRGKSARRPRLAKVSRSASTLANQESREEVRKFLDRHRRPSCVGAAKLRVNGGERSAAAKS